MSELKEIAEKFGMSVTQFAEKSGYTRQGLYIKLKKNNRNARKFDRFLKFLKFLDEEIYIQEIGEAEKRHTQRKMLIEKLRGDKE